MKLTSLSSTQFSIGGIVLNKGEWFPVYDKPNFSVSTGDVSGGLDAKVNIAKIGSPEVKLFSDFKKASDFFDADGEKYISFDDFTSDLQTILGSSVSQAGGDSEEPYKSYVALISQSGTSAPTAKILENTLGATISFSRTSAGVYVLTASSSVFTADKTSINYTYSPRQYQTAIMEVFGRTTSTITLRTADLDVEATPPQYNTADCPFTDIHIEIRVYN